MVGILSSNGAAHVHDALSNLNSTKGSSTFVERTLPANGADGHKDARSNGTLNNGHGVEEDIHSNILKAPLRPTGLLESKGIHSFVVTPAIGTEFPKGSIDLAGIVNAPDSEERDALLRELASLVSHRGVLFFRYQPNLTPDSLLTLASKLGELSGKPKASKLHIHPVTKAVGTNGEAKGEKISSEPDAEGRQIGGKSKRSNLASAGWHTDISFEPHPSDYAILQLRTLPPYGGDTLWSSQYSAYDALSPAMQKFLEGLTATHDGAGFREQAKAGGFELNVFARGHPDNIGGHLYTSHPVVRTNPVTGWKGLYVNKGFTKRINELSVDESDALLAYLFNHIAENFNFQVRFRWEKDDVVIWDNRSTNHSANYDYGSARRGGDRAASIGEKPYFDAQRSQSRQEYIDGIRDWDDNIRAYTGEYN